jgi:hypothetical protein
MHNNIGIFLNNTNSEIGVQINLHNYNILKNNFKKIIIIDIENDLSLKLKDLITNNNDNDNKIITYLNDNNNIKNDLCDLNINAIINLFNIFDQKIHDLECKYLTFISDNYIYCNNLFDYFQYINIHNLDFYSYTDSSEIKYHYQLYFFSISYISLELFKNFILNSDNIKNIEIELYKTFDKIQIKHFINNKIPFLKLAYLNENISNNIFNNNKLYKILFNNKLLPIININYLFNCKNNFNITTIHTNIPQNFDIEIYKKYDDLKDKSDIFLQNHFLLNGQFENRNYSEDGNSILPNFIRTVLKSFNLLYFFDVPDNFSIEKYKKYNNDLVKLSIKDLYLHWINYGHFENRKYCD